ncbi:hypothetical protein [Aurantivibrio plasticivorans]
MNSHNSPVFIDRRNNDRRTDHDPCEKLDIDLYNRKRRKSTDRRSPDKSLADDYYAFTHQGDDSPNVSLQPPGRELS